MNLAVLLLTCHSGASFGHNGLIVMYPVIDLNLSQEQFPPACKPPFFGGEVFFSGGGVTSVALVVLFVS